MIDDDYLTLRGVALRGERLNRTDELSRGVTFSDGEVSVRTTRDALVGTARLSFVDGDVVADVTVPASEITGILDAPYLCVAAKLNDDGPAEIGFILVCATSSDALQLPYRLTRVPESRHDVVQRAGYRATRVIDEAHLVEFSLENGRWDAGFDEAKSHVEWQHDLETRHVDTANAIARGLGYESWADLGENDVSHAQAIFTELSHLGLLGHR